VAALRAPVLPGHWFPPSVYSKAISLESAIADFEGLEVTQDGFVLMPSRKDRRSAWLVVLFMVVLMGGLNAIAISTGHVVAVAITASLGIFFVFVAWFTTKPPVFALRGQQITLLGNVQRMRMSKTDLESVRRGRSTDRDNEKTYWLHKKEGPTSFYVYVRHFDPGALEEAIRLLGVEITGDFSS
jgi:hypothetical protein